MSVLLKIWVALQAVTVALAVIVFIRERKEKKRAQQLCRRCKNLERSHNGGMFTGEWHFCPYINGGRECFVCMPNTCSHFEEKETK